MYGASLLLQRSLCDQAIAECLIIVVRFQLRSRRTSTRRPLIVVLRSAVMMSSAIKDVLASILQLAPNRWTAARAREYQSVWTRSGSAADRIAFGPWGSRRPGASASCPRTSADARRCRDEPSRIPDCTLACSPHRMILQVAPRRTPPEVRPRDVPQHSCRTRAPRWQPAPRTVPWSSLRVHPLRLRGFGVRSARRECDDRACETTADAGQSDG